ncbi:methylmalonyl-CoA mutase subunit beta [Tenacibaculum jejuense]|uniref:Methylmalonyl-CoA mutase small subunit n=1 Tax=Tenacibaculum jejuense TaxID=584609 RepID=A0A238U6V2_9FLAO|nr:methylmalonyl-CoA mutase subunit beta [Tenacibaculum jejuense]SNR14931.1 Methylmalonyl-CoA mutase small subunit [Tenacibaculum jejuense]
MENFLFDEFEGVSEKAWKQKIQVDLKGLDYNKTLLWNTNEGITVRPFYSKEDQTHQKIQLPSSNFSICESIFIDDVYIANKLANDALQRGANAIEFIVDEEFDIEKLLNNLQLKSETKTYFKFNFLDANFVKKLSDFLINENVYFNIDIIGNLAKTGNWYSNLQSDHKQLESISSINNSIAVNASTYQNAGANCTQQLAYALAHANEYLNHFGAKIADQVHFNFSVGTNYFFEIAKLRAFRILWQSLLKEYDISENEAHIFVQPTLRNKTLYDYNTNMLRTTSECMSAILGGANTISNASYDEIFHKSNEFGERISRNQLLVIKEESGFENAQHFADGSYYIESITHQLAENALEIFKQIEQGGGFLKQLKEGIIQRKIEESAQKEQGLFDQGELVLLGTNKIQNENDRMKNDLELFPFVKKRSEKTLIQPIITKRLAEKLEQERLENE